MIGTTALHAVTSPQGHDIEFDLLFIGEKLADFHFVFGFRQGSVTGGGSDFPGDGFDFGCGGFVLGDKQFHLIAQAVHFIIQRHHFLLMFQAKHLDLRLLLIGEV